MQRDINVKPEFRKFFLDCIIRADPIHIEPPSAAEAMPKVTIAYWIKRLEDCGAIPTEMARELQDD